MGREHWIRDTINNVVFSVPTGVQNYKGKKKYFSTGSIQDTGFIDDGEFSFQEKPSRANRIAQLNDVLQARMINTNKPILIDNNLEGCLFSTGFIQLHPFANTYNSKFLYYYIQSYYFLSQKDDLATGSTQKALTDTKACELEFPLPPLNEQKRIVEKLDTILPKVKSIKGRLSKIPGILNKFRRSVLTAVFSGKLTEDWREGNFNSDDWKDFNLSDLIYDGPQNGLYKSMEFYGSGILIVRIDNFYDGYLNDWSEMKRLSLTEKELQTYKLRENDFLVNRVNSIDFLGKSALVRNLKEPCVFESNMMRFSVRLEIVDPEYLIKYLNSEFGHQELRKNAKDAVNQSSINQEDVKAVLVPLPPLEEQHEIVRRVEKLFNFTISLEAKYKIAMKLVEKIEQSVLAMAFRGELVEPDPNDEPAEELLKRILEQKAKLEGGKIRKKRGRK